MIYLYPKKISYILAILAGELKHGPLGLVDGGTPILAVVSKDATYQVCLNVFLSNVPYHIFIVPRLFSQLAVISTYIDDDRAGKVDFSLF